MAQSEDPAADQARQTIMALRQENADLQLRLTAALADCRRSETALRAAQRLETLGHLAGGMAHDFSNVLQAVLAVASMLKRHPDDADRVLRHAAMLQKATARGTAITSRLLAYGRVREAGLETVQPESMLTQLRESLVPTMPEITIELRCAPDAPELTVDRGQLEMTLINLANNARDAVADTGGVMTLAADPAGSVPGHPELTSPAGFVCFSVTDTGIGMDAETMARAAEPFFTTKPVGKGTGLGLALAYRFCRHAGGALTIESQVGHGTTIRLYLPAGDDVARLCDTAPDAAAPRFAIPGPVVVLIQNEPVVRDGLRTALLSRGFRVLDASEIHSGCAACAVDVTPDLLVADVSAGSVAGLEEVRVWRGRVPDLKVVVLQDSATYTDAIGGAVIRLVKPVSPSDLAVAAVRLIAGAGTAPGSPVALEPKPVPAAVEAGEN